MTTVYLPYPPTANNLFPSGKSGKRFISPEYKAWKQLAGYTLNTQHPKPVPGKVAVAYEFRKPDKRRRDCFNLEKAVTDLLVDAGVIGDDSLIEEGTVRWVYDVPWEVRAVISPVVP